MEYRRLEGQERRGRGCGVGRGLGLARGHAHSGIAELVIKCLYTDRKHWRVESSRSLGDRAAVGVVRGMVAVFETSIGMGSPPFVAARSQRRLDALLSYA